MFDEQLSQVDPLLTEGHAAEILGTTRGTLRQSRYTGILFGRPAPPFVKAGKSIRYRRSRIQAFIGALSDFQNTSESKQAIEVDSE